MLPSKANTNFKIVLLVAALGYFVDIYDLLLFGIIRIPSLRSLGLSEEKILTKRWKQLVEIILKYVTCAIDCAI